MLTARRARGARFGHHTLVQLREVGRSSATVTLTTSELLAVNNALNEVCHGVQELDDDNEFATCIGVPRNEARRLLAELGPVVNRTNELPD